MSGHWRDGKHLAKIDQAVVAVSIGIVAYLVILPVSMLIFGSFSKYPPGSPQIAFTLDNYVSAFTNVRSLPLLWNSIIYATCVTLMSLLYGGLLAWVVAKTNAPFPKFVEYAVILSQASPPMLQAIGWTFLLSPRIGMINEILKTVLNTSVNLYSMPGLIFVGSIAMMPWAYILLVNSFRTMDPALEEAARASGSSVLRTLRDVTFPLMKPTIAASGVLIFVLSLQHFEIPFFVGAPGGILVYSTAIYNAISQSLPPNWALATSYSMVFFMISTIGLIIYRRTLKHREEYQTVTGRGYRESLVDLGKWRKLVSGIMLTAVVFTVVTPNAILLLASFTRPFLLEWETLNTLTLSNYSTAFRIPSALRAFANSLILGTVGATLLMTLSMIVGYITIRTRRRGKALLDGVAMMPMAFPGSSIAVGLMWTYLLLPTGNFIYGTLNILLIAYVTGYLPVAIRAVSGGLVQIHDDLEGSARVHGASWLRTFTTIVGPLLKGSFLAGWLFVFIHIIREMSMSMLLYGHGSETISVVVATVWEMQQVENVAAIGVVLLAITLVTTIVARKVFGARLSLF